MWTGEVGGVDENEGKRVVLKVLRRECLADGNGPRGGLDWISDCTEMLVSRKRNAR